MPTLQTYPLPLPTSNPPEGFGFETLAISERSATTAFETGLEERDRIGGRRYCIVCGPQNQVQHCHIIPKVENETWELLKQYRYIPSNVKSVKHEPRNGITMCPNHRINFDHLNFFIRYSPAVQKYIFINHSGLDEYVLSPFHGKAVALDRSDNRAPFPALFLIHEQRVRGRWPFSPHPDIPAEPSFPDWFVAEEQIRGDLNQVSDQARPLAPSGGNAVASTSSRITGTYSRRQASDSGTNMQMTLDSETIEDILQATWTSESWRACVREGPWEGTAEDNIIKYRERMLI